MATDIEINLRIKALALQKDMSDIKKMLKTSFSELEAGNLVKTQDALKGVNKSIKNITDSGKAAARQLKYQSTAFKDINTIIKDIDKGIKKQKPQFQSWALSIMFAGMAMQRMAEGMATWGVKAYDDVSHSIIGTITENDRLQGSLMYLGYTVGEALQPFLAMLVPIVMWLAELVSEHKTFTGILITSALVLGILLSTLGGIVLAWAGIKAGMLAVFGIDMAGWAATSGGAVGALTNSFKTLASTVGTYFGVTGVVITSLFGMIIAIGLVMYWIFKLQDAMGGWGEFGKSVVRGLTNAFTLFGDFLANGIITVLQTLIALSANVVDWVGIRPPDWMFDFVNMKSKSSLTELAVAVEQSSWLAPSKGYATGGFLVPTYDSLQKDMGSMTNNNNNSNTTIQIQNVNLPSVTDGQQFAGQLKDLQHQLNGYN